MVPISLTCVIQAAHVMANSEELYDAIEADDADTISQLLTRQPGLINSVEEAPPPIHWAIYRDRRRAGRQPRQRNGGGAQRRFRRFRRVEELRSGTA